MARAETPLSEALRATKPALRSAFCLSVFINLTLFAAPIYSMQVYDHVLTSRNLGTLMMLTLIVGAFLALYAILEYSRSGVLVRGGVRFSEVISKPLFEQAMRAQLAGRPVAAGQALRDAETLKDALSGSTVSTLFDIPWTPVFVLVCFTFHSAMGTVALTGALVILVCATLTEFATKSWLTSANMLSAEANRFSSASLRNAEIVRGLGMDAAVLCRWRAVQGAAIAAQSTAGEKAGMLLAVSKVARMSVQVALIGTGAWLAIDRLISPGLMMAASIIMARALAPVEHAVANWKRLIAARAAFQRLEELLRSLPPPPAATKLPAPKGRLVVEDLMLQPATGGAAILKNVSFELEAGASLAIIGPSGGGKSSLLKAAAGIWQPARGSVRLDGAALSQWDQTQLGRQVGYLPQDVEFFAGTVAENIARLEEPDDKAVIAAATTAGVHEAILRGYQSPLDEGRTVLSGGMRQRVALARALYGNPCLIIMDEPNSNLDGNGDKALARAIAKLKEDRRTVVVVTHKPQLLAHVEYVLVLDGGKVQAFGNRDDVISRIGGTNISALKAKTSAAALNPASSGGGQPVPRLAVSPAVSVPAA